MRTLSITQAARNFSAVVNKLETEQEEIMLLRNHKPVARLVPEPPAQNALEVFRNLYRILDEDTASALTDAMADAKKRKRGTLKELRTPWVS